MSDNEAKGGNEETTPSTQGQIDSSYEHAAKLLEEFFSDQPKPIPTPTHLHLREQAHAARGSKPGEPAYKKFQEALTAQREAEAREEEAAARQREEDLARQNAEAQARDEHSNKFRSSVNDPLVKARTGRSH